MGVMLVGLVRSESRVPPVFSMHTGMGELVCTPRTINGVFSDHLREAYRERLCPSSGDLWDFLANVPLSSLVMGIREALGGIFTREEIIATIRLFKAAKTPDSDGQPVESYQWFAEVIAD
ncbi:hypothetical protein NDU88_002096 [Pleurodeles waltl]|uniref:Uncharacterized protein n=1 Tax=Pleurodeles waltl TaxID=8319 RepID=A0AAV7SBI5_PLEWA|nr:hypothetical protein NDU88_002096 [Pleurodeles waltl]